MIPTIILLFLIAALDWVAIARDWKKVEFIAKPAVMLVLFGLLLLVAQIGGFISLPLICFALGIFFSLVGDVFLMVSYARFSDRWFISGLVAFGLAQVSYIVGLNIPLPDGSPIWSLGLAVILALSSGRILRRIMVGIRQKSLRRLERPVMVYGTVVTLMLLSALLALNNSVWKVFAAGLVALGAVLFYSSNVLLAWNKFIVPIKNGRLANTILYHLGQFALVAGVILQFGS